MSQSVGMSGPKLELNDLENHHKLESYDRNINRVNATAHHANLYYIFVVVFSECRQCLSNWEVQMWQMAPCHKLWDSAVLLKLVSLRFMHSTLRYSPNVKDIQRHF